MSDTLSQKIYKWVALVLALLVLNGGAAQGVELDLPVTVPIPAGDFMMGSTRAERDAAYDLDEHAYGHSRTRQWKWYENEPPHRVQTQAYNIARNLISNEQYAVFIQETLHPAPNVDRATWQGYKLVHPYERTRKFIWYNGHPPKGRGQHPVVLISHDDAKAYARWLSKKTGKSWRLPTEAQWEKAAKGTDGRWFPWGNVFDPEKLNSHDQGPFDTAPVGSYPQGISPFGLLDGAGQVFEWTSTEDGPNRYLVKGGSWDDKGCGVCRPAARHTRPGILKHILVGFRLVTKSN